MGRLYRFYLERIGVLCPVALLLLCANISGSGEEPIHLTIAVLQGEGALNDISKRTAREPIVRVEDENHRPVAGAAVVFALPNEGPSGSFVNGVRVLSTTTDRTGKAIGTGFRPNQVAGSYTIQVTASQGTLVSSLAIHEVNSSGTSSSSSSHNVAVRAFPLKLTLIGVAVAGGTAGAIIASMSKSKAISISTGGTTVGAPQVKH
jgi:hypothetical protein